MNDARNGRASPTLATIAGRPLDGPGARPRRAERVEVPPPLPTRRERLAAAAEAFAFLRSKLRDESTPEALRVRIATTLVGFATDPSGWARMPGEEVVRRFSYSVEDHPFAEGS